jgi:hypothetical protein
LMTRKNMATAQDIVDALAALKDATEKLSAR